MWTNADKARIQSNFVLCVRHKLLAPTGNLSTKRDAMEMVFQNAACFITESVKLIVAMQLSNNERMFFDAISSSAAKSC